MKRIICSALCAVLLVALFGCTKEPETTLTDTYLQIAQAHMNDGNTEAAIQALEQGLSFADDPRLRQLLEELKTPPTTEATEGVSVDGFLGSWTSETCRMEITAVDSTLQLHMRCVSYRVVEFDLTLSTDPATAEQNKLIFPFSDDGCGNQGNVVIYLEGDTINYVISDYVAKSEYGIQTSYAGGSLTRHQEVQTNAGPFDDVAGVYADVDSGTMHLFLGYDSEAKEAAYAQFTLPSPIEGLQVQLEEREGDTFYGALFEGFASEPTATVAFTVTASGTLVASISYYTSRGLYESTIEYKATSASAIGFENPFYTD